MTGIGGHHRPPIGLVNDLAVLVAAVNVRGIASMTKTGIGIGKETEITGTIGTEDEGVAPPHLKGGVLPVPTGGRPKNASMTVQGPHPHLMT